MTTMVPLYEAGAWAFVACSVGVALGMVLEAWRARRSTST